MSNSTNIRGHVINHETVQQNFWTSVGRHEWEESTFDVIDKYVKPGTTFVDIGAWNGVLSLYAASLGAKCYAIEPDPVALSYMQDNIQRNEILFSRIMPINFAISDKEETCELKSSNGDWGNSMSSLIDQDGAPRDVTSVSTITLEGLIEMGEIDLKSAFIKIDIEGAEIKVIPNSKEYLAKHKPTIYMSLHSFWFPDYPKNASDIADVIFPIYRVLLNGVKEITRDQLIIEMDKKDGVDILLLPRTETVGLVIPVFNRPDYLKRCLASLENLTVYPDYIVIVDDGSTNKEVDKIIEGFLPLRFQLYSVRFLTNVGVKKALKEGIELAFDRHCDIVINLDSDAIVKPDFIEKLLSLHKGKDACIVGGFNSASNRNKVLAYGNGFVVREHINGINMCFNRSQYDEYIKPSLQSEGNWDYNVSTRLIKDNHAVITAMPSLVEHIGEVSSMGHHNFMEIAADFKPLTLKNVTLFGIDANDPQGLRRAAEICQRNIEFGDAVIITDRLFPGTTREIGRANYSRFMIKELDKYIHTSHVLTIHADGYVVNWKAWEDEFLKYDYIGATWAFKDNKNVGNGGFSLRSKKLINILATDNDIVEFMPEDDRICRYYRSYLEQGYGIKFAPEEVANRFSIEAYGSWMFDSGGFKGNQYNGQFGFHSPHPNFDNYAEYGIDPEILLPNLIKH